MSGILVPRPFHRFFQKERRNGRETREIPGTRPLTTPVRQERMPLIPRTIRPLRGMKILEREPMSTRHTSRKRCGRGNGREPKVIVDNRIGSKSVSDAPHLPSHISEAKRGSYPSRPDTDCQRNPHLLPSSEGRTKEGFGVSPFQKGSTGNPGRDLPPASPRRSLSEAWFSVPCHLFPDPRRDCGKEDVYVVFPSAVLKRKASIDG